MGNTRALLDATASVTDTLTTDAWGVELARTGVTVDPYLAFGQWGYYRDASSRLYVRARHLRTDLGRWVSRDPIGYGGGESANLLVYCGNGPVGMFDPTGLKRGSIPFCKTFFGDAICEGLAQCSGAATGVFLGHIWAHDFLSLEDVCSVAPCALAIVQAGLETILKITSPAMKCVSSIIFGLGQSVANALCQKRHLHCDDKINWGCTLMMGLASGVLGCLPAYMDKDPVIRRFFTGVVSAIGNLMGGITCKATVPA